MGYSAMKQDPDSVFEESELCEALRPAYESDTENGMPLGAFFLSTHCTALECNLHVLVIVFFSPHSADVFKPAFEKPREVSESGSFSSLHFVHLRGLPFQATAQDIINVRRG